jgi:hypothetical protein
MSLSNIRTIYYAFNVLDICLNYVLITRIDVVFVFGSKSVYAVVFTKTSIIFS